MKKVLLAVLILSGASTARAALALSEPTAARVPPLFWYESDPEQERRFAMALLLYWSVRDRRDRLTLMAPFYYNASSPDEQLRILLPLHFLYRSQDRRLNLWGPYFSQSSLRSRTRLFIPFYYETSNEDGRFRVLLFSVRQQNARARMDFVLPLYGSYRPTDLGQNAYQAFLPFYFKLWNRERRTLVSPLFWAYRDPQVSMGLVPPYFWRHAPGSKIEVGLPIYGRYLKESDGKKRDVQVAVPWFRLQFDSTTYRGFLPLYLGRTRWQERPSGGSEGRRSSWDVVPGLYFSNHLPNGEDKVLTPLFSRFRDQDGSAYGHTGPYFYSQGSEGEKLSGVFPLYYRSSDPESSRFRLISFYRMRSHDGLKRQSTLFPLFRYRRDSDRRQWLTPVFYRDEDPDLSRGFFLNYFWKTERNPDRPGHPVVQSRRFLFPLAWHSWSEHERTSVFAPLAAFHEEADYRLAFFAPFYFSRTKGEERLWIVPPMIARDSPQRHWRGLMFLYWQTSRPDRSAVTLLPFFRRTRFPQGSSLYFPGFYYLSDGGRTEGAVGPYFWDDRGKTRYRIFAPLYADFERPTWRLKMVFPGYRFRNSRIDEKGLFPIWAVTRGVETSTASVSRWTPRTETVSVSTETDLIEQPVSTYTFTSYLANSHRVLPFYFYRKSREGSELILPFLLAQIEREKDDQGRPLSRGRYLLLGAWEKGADRFEHRFDPLYAYHRTPDRKGFVSPTAPLPLWRYEVFGLRSGERTVYGAVFPYYWKDSPEVRKDLVLPVFYHRRLNDVEKKKEKAELTWLLLYYSSRDFEEGDRKRILVPLYWHFADRSSSWTLMPLYWGDRGLGYERRVFFPLWWSFRRDQERLRAFFPFFLSSSDPSERKNTLIFPGYWRSRSAEGSTLLAGNYFKRVSRNGSESTTVFAPFYWSASEPGRRTRTVFPLYWNWSAPERTVTYLFPLYLHHRRPNFSGSVLFPVFWRFALQDQVVRVIPPYFSIDALDTGTRTTGFAPLWTYARNRRRDWSDFRLLGGLIGYERAGDSRHLTLLYFLRI